MCNSLSNGTAYHLPSLHQPNLIELLGTVKRHGDATLILVLFAEYGWEHELQFTGIKTLTPSSPESDPKK